jgi:SAM-dependent methyltransferase
MSDIVTAERECYEEMWGVEQYADVSPGARFATVFDGLVRERGDDPRHLTVLDAGCGSGKGALALTTLGYRLTLCDLTLAGLMPDARMLPCFEAALWGPLTAHYVFGGRYDYVYCCDVLEHLPTVFVGLAITQMLAVARKGLFISVALAPDNLGVWVGRPLHLTVQPYVWWRDHLRELGRVVEARDLINEGIYLVEPRP